jgi:hypothetical protein
MSASLKFLLSAMQRKQLRKLQLNNTTVHFQVVFARIKQMQNGGWGGPAPTLRIELSHKCRLGK